MKMNVKAVRYTINASSSVNLCCLYGGVSGGGFQRGNGNNNNG